MELIRARSTATDMPEGGVVTVGNFDGVHLGHQRLVQGVVERARELGCESVVLTFEPHPERVLRPRAELRLLCTPGQRAQLLARLGVDVLVEVPFDRGVAEIPALVFARDFFLERLRPVEIHLGEEFRYGRDRAGDVRLLSVLAGEFGCSVRPVEPVTHGGEAISSTRVRREVARGNVETAGELLGRPVLVDGTVYSGERMGRRLGFPTINIGLENELAPAHGVYVTAVHIPSFGQTFPSVTNIGVRPTVYENYAVTVESHILDFTGSVYQEPVRLFFLRRLREERLFRSSMELVTQIHRDVEAAREYFLVNGLPLGRLVEP